MFEQLGKKPTGELCKGMEGLVKEGQEQLESDEEGATKDICIAGAALRVEHYEIAGYTAAIAIARSLGKDEIVALLEETLLEEEEAGEKVLQQTQPLIEEASADLEDEDAETEDESDEEAPARRASGVGKHPTKRSSR